MKRFHGKPKYTGQHLEVCKYNSNQYSLTTREELCFIKVEFPFRTLLRAGRSYSTSSKPVSLISHGLGYRCILYQQVAFRLEVFWSFVSRSESPIPIHFYVFRLSISNASLGFEMRRKYHLLHFNSGW